MSRTLDSVVLLISCLDRKGIVARVAGFIHDFGGNILDSDHHTDRETGHFLMRTEFELDDFQVPRDEIASAFEPVAKVFDMQYSLHDAHHRPRVAILVSKQDLEEVVLARAVRLHVEHRVLVYGKKTVVFH